MLSLLVAATMPTALAVPNPRVLIFSKTTGFRHDNIPSAIAAIKKLGQEHNFTVDATEDSNAFTTQNLHKYDLVCFASTTGTILDDSQKKALEQFVEGGKGWMGIHSASDTEYDWAWYGKLVGAYFKGHPPGGQRVWVKIENRGNPSTNAMPKFWVRPDEWYDFRTNPRENVTVLASLDESFYRDNPQDHPIAWCHWQGRGRSWYTEMGHFQEAYTDPMYVQHLYGGLMWAAQGNAMPAGAQPFPTQKSGRGLVARGGAGGSYLHFNFQLKSGGKIFLKFGGDTISLSDDANCGSMGSLSPSTNAYAGSGTTNVFDAIYQPAGEGHPARILEARLNGVIIHSNDDFPKSDRTSRAYDVSIESTGGSTLITEPWIKPM